MYWFAFACELARDWQMDLEGLANAFGPHLPNYEALSTDTVEPSLQLDPDFRPYLLTSIH
jgi:hypothetical protein